MNYSEKPDLILLKDRLDNTMKGQLFTRIDLTDLDLSHYTLSYIVQFIDEYFISRNFGKHDKTLSFFNTNQSKIKDLTTKHQISYLTIRLDDVSGPKTTANRNLKDGKLRQAERNIL